MCAGEGVNPGTLGGNPKDCYPLGHNCYPATLKGTMSRSQEGCTYLRNVPGADALSQHHLSMPPTGQARPPLLELSAPK